VTRFGITGHQDLPSEASTLARSRMRKLLEPHRGPALRGVTSLAAGADQLFATIVVSLDGELEVIIPAADYASTFSSRALDTFETLLAAAATIDQLPFVRSSEDAFWAAGRAVADRCDVLLAVWDGQPSRGLGGTADVVHYAREHGTTVKVIWPHDLKR
jgi:hypothetical protein